MADRPAESEPNARKAGQESYFGLLANLGGIALLLTALLAVNLTGEKRPPKPVFTESAKARAPSPAAVIEARAEPPKPRPKAPAPIEPDQVAIGKAQEALDAAVRDRQRAEERAARASSRLSLASTTSATAASRSRRLGERIKDPSATLARANTVGGFLKADRDRLKNEISALASAPRPKAKTIVDQNPVARPAGGDEFHFEIRRHRVSFIDLERLLNLVRSDAQLRIRLSDNNRQVENKVGPVGAFSLEYVLARALPNGVQELMERHGLSYDLRGWEVVPDFEGRGETYDEASKPISEFARAINRLNPGNVTITMWVYPDGFDLFRRLRDDLHSRGFLVAARPLPEGMAIRGSPAGSLSAGQ